MPLPFCHADIAYAQRRAYFMPCRHSAHAPACCFDMTPRYAIYPSHDTIYRRSTPAPFRAACCATMAFFFYAATCPSLRHAMPLPPLRYYAVMPLSLRRYFRRFFAFASFTPHAAAAAAASPYAYRHAFQRFSPCYATLDADESCYAITLSPLSSHVCRHTLLLAACCCLCHIRHAYAAMPYYLDYEFS